MMYSPGGIHLQGLEPGDNWYQRPRTVAGNNGHSECRLGRSLHYPPLSGRHPAWKQWMKLRPDQSCRPSHFLPWWRCTTLGSKPISPVIFWSHLCIFPTQNSNDWGENESVRIKIFETEQRAWSSAGRMASQLVEQCGGLLKIRKKRQPPDAHWMCCCQSVKTREADLCLESASRLLYCTLVLYWATAKSSTEVPNAQLAVVCNRHLEHRCL